MNWRDLWPRRPTDPCAIRWCKSGEPATKTATDCHDDGAWNVGICESCHRLFGGGDLPEAAEVKRRCNERDRTR